MIELYTSPTPNGYKISVALEELEIPYNVHVVNLQAGDQKKPEFLAMNPNGRIPVIVDTENDNLSIMESGAQLIYLAEKAGKLLPTESIATFKSYSVVNVSNGRNWSDDGAGQCFLSLLAW